jgi:phosphoglucosamine mutase
VELEIEGRLGDGAGEVAPAHQLGRAQRLDDALGRYIEFVKSSFPRGLRLDGLKVVIDCANGAAYRVAPKVLYELGAEVVPIGVYPDGFNINQRCGATDPARMQEAVVTQGADFGIALDGDADRAILADEKGKVVDGDQVMALVGRSWLQDGRLAGGAVVATVMSNLGLERFLNGLGCGLVRTPVGDRYVVERMREGGYNVGGEQSGHIVLSDFATTGDGLIAALQVLAVVVQAGKPASEVTRLFDPLPQLLRNVRFNGGAPLEDETVQAAIRDGESRLGQAGRLVIRKSGTEPLIRVMAEGEDEAVVGQVVGTICQTIEQWSGARRAG